MRNNTLDQAALRMILLKDPITEFIARVSAPVNLSKTLNRLIFDTLLRQDTLLPDELENLHALSDLLLSFQLLSQATVVNVPEA